LGDRLRLADQAPEMVVAAICMKCFNRGEHHFSACQIIKIVV
jgi:hypothetical protein